MSSRMHVRALPILVAFTLVASALGAVPSSALAASAPRPSVAGLSVHAAALAGGKRIAVAGAHFAHDAKVEFGMARGRAVRVVSPTRLTVVVPRHKSGAVNVRVVTAAGRSSRTRTARFTYVPPPTVTGILPAYDSVAGGRRITLRGKNFLHVKKVLFGAKAGRGVQVSSATGLSVTVPSATRAGLVEVRVVAGYGTSARTAHDSFGYDQRLGIATKSLPTGMGGVPYSTTLHAAGGRAPYRWSARGLPAGVTLGAAGAVTGAPTSTGTARPTVTVTDAHGQHVARTFSLAVPDSLPADCSDADGCAHTALARGTVLLDAGQVVDVYRTTDSTGELVPGSITGVVVSGTAPAAGTEMVVPAVDGAPSGYIGSVDAVTDNGDGTSTLSTTQGTPQDAFSTAVIQKTGGAAEPDPLDPSASNSVVLRNGKVSLAKQLNRAIAHTDKGPVSCTTPDVDITFQKFTVDAHLKPTVAMDLKPDLFDAYGGLNFFRVGISAGLDVDLEMSVSAKTTCTVQIPALKVIIPVGELGVVILRVIPALKVELSGTLHFSTGAHLDCGASYQWAHGAEARDSYCHNSSTPVQLKSDTGIDATVTATVDVSATLDDLVGIHGNITGGLHFGWHPKQHPVAELDAKVTWSFELCLLCFGGTGVYNVPIIKGTLFDGPIWKSDHDPGPPVDPGPLISTAALPKAVQGKQYSTQLHTVSGAPGTWAVTAGDPLPPGLTLSGDTIAGTPTSAPVTARFTVRFTEGTGRSVTAPLELQVRSPAQPQPPTPRPTVVTLTEVSPTPLAPGAPIGLAAHVTGPSANVRVGFKVIFCFVDAVFSGECGPQQPNTLCETTVQAGGGATCTSFFQTSGTYDVFATYVGLSASARSATVKVTVTTGG